MNKDLSLITPANCFSLPGPFFHGTKARLAIGDLLTTPPAADFGPLALSA